MNGGFGDGFTDSGWVSISPLSAPSFEIGKNSYPNLNPINSNFPVKTDRAWAGTRDRLTQHKKFQKTQTIAKSQKLTDKIMHWDRLDSELDKIMCCPKFQCRKLWIWISKAYPNH
ncbi:hypothetical protein TSUD_145020 [Trifolium subterraneum]|uniref:Uncharacterized protein n=1 Tax=Trifolium subterraneum TaxID=3900 RepID=A0A2Z6N4A1_TRISU|nr:hypothetical protein TSUD_145020 [Trifolium subterraneum]